MSTVTGVDAQGCVLTLDDVAFQPEFEPLLADVIASLSLSGLDGIYVYGSVARGEASPGESDLDLSLILLEPPDASVLAHLQALRQSLEQSHPEVTKIDFDIGHRAEVLAPENANKWGFWLKHHCRCVWGEDLSLRFERFQPSREIALALNADFEPVLSEYLTRIEKASTPLGRLRLQCEAARKLIRATNTLRARNASTWPHTLEEHVAAFIQHHPTMRIQIAYFLFEARNPSAEGEAFTTRLRTFIDWMVLQQA
ncbi:DNA polymerase III subunit beta [Pseudomonas sp. Leaf15]|uniref:nucleotidyltransferase domain-containing protein n=1 Tax=unclassified Pseudomonas TaxID=196821 RepID=UPI000702A4B2|nr:MULTISPECIES: nucleotidyltransferase domain-containing protein [unclassified Pseudomonas]KQM50793.1 DNA polymerase III subunit beta [Pseudomonas sp. Leaf15]RAH04441.1 DNA polymerase III subunit beta [Pseudomonas sp. Leaf98]